MTSFGRLSTKTKFLHPYLSRSEDIGIFLSFCFSNSVLYSCCFCCFLRPHSLAFFYISYQSRSIKNCSITFNSVKQNYNYLFGKTTVFNTIFCRISSNEYNLILFFKDNFKTQHPPSGGHPTLIKAYVHCPNPCDRCGKVLLRPW